MIEMKENVLKVEFAVVIWYLVNKKDFQEDKVDYWRPKLDLETTQKSSFLRPLNQKAFWCKPMFTFPYHTTNFLYNCYVTRKYPLRGYILGVLTHTTALEQLWISDETLTMWF